MFSRGAGFEPAVRVNGLRASRPLHSTALSPLLGSQTVAIRPRGATGNQAGPCPRPWPPGGDAPLAAAPSDRSVAQEHDATAKGLALHQVQARDPGRVREQPLAAPEHDWIGEERVLVDEPGGDQLAHEPDAAGGHDAPAHFGPQRSDVVDASQQGPRAPTWGLATYRRARTFETSLR